MWDRVGPGVSAAAIVTVAITVITFVSRDASTRIP